jgi:hypothetical protein
MLEGFHLFFAMAKRQKKQLYRMPVQFRQSPQRPPLLSMPRAYTHVLSQWCWLPLDIEVPLRLHSSDRLNRAPNPVARKRQTNAQYDDHCGRADLTEHKTAYHVHAGHENNDMLSLVAIGDPIAKERPIGAARPIIVV